ncbi:hypothetical protein FGO68_gene15834 [Halteria grandinella]|uniref:Uncharacterized protein n=1 Tax=Halteria grandinella TaxID=5974 RepID=A0A8J8SV38_HALGN|nr:hypothetical protein FGO68_gene15834 [Halteria grandinella]
MKFAQYSSILYILMKSSLFKNYPLMRRKQRVNPLKQKALAMKKQQKQQEALYRDISLVCNRMDDFRTHHKWFYYIRTSFLGTVSRLHMP